MYQDGMCRISDNYYSKTIEFQDINYQLAQNEDKEAIFENWCEFLNYFDSSIHFQFTFFNTAAGADGFENSIHSMSGIYLFRGITRCRSPPPPI